MLNACNFDAQAFGAFLSQPHKFVLDLRNASLMDCIREYVKLRKRVSPGFARNYTLLVRCIEGLNFISKSEIMPVHVTDVFWTYFHPYLYQRGLRSSTVVTLSHQLMSTLSFASKHGCQISDTYNMVDLPKGKSEQIALTLDEISHIYHFDIDSMPYRARLNL